ncbi:hypothetical protein KAR91_30590 [Candidatus Pacearchaeota archaeon]|nr:hypothetical protein [Candidatus Pacearchaeota archaeon]
MEEDIFQGNLNASGSKLREEDIEEYSFRIQQAIEAGDKKLATRLIDEFNATYSYEAVRVTRVNIDGLVEKPMNENNDGELRLWIQKTHQAAKFYLRNKNGGRVSL